jgi:hypothetical protein
MQHSLRLHAAFHGSSMQIICLIVFPSMLRHDVCWRDIVLAVAVMVQVKRCCGSTPLRSALRACYRVPASVLQVMLCISLSEMC